MKINLENIKIKDLVNSYLDNVSTGQVIGYGGNLNIRPEYQREFVYKEKERNAVIDTVQKGFPLNVMYWVEDGNGNFEVLDGQQRTISICEYIQGNFSLNGLAFHNLPKNKQNDILEYKLMVYFCNGTDSEKLEWFKIINIAGVKLKEQELRNAIYTGNWLADAKINFSKKNCMAYQVANDKNYCLMDGEINRQDYLETALKWISKDDIESYMSKHQPNADADELCQYFKDVINWVKKIFTTPRKQMKGIEWGFLYNKYNHKKFNSNDVEKKVAELMEDDEVDNKKGIYEYILSEHEKYLSLRAFSDKDKAQAFTKQTVAVTGKACCPKCDNSKLYDLDQMEADHVVAWSKGGKTTMANCQMLCKFHNGSKSNS